MRPLNEPYGLEELERANLAKKDWRSSSKGSGRACINVFKFVLGELLNSCGVA